ncbi:hypothetical protein DFS33DRAFT_1378050 [Desarmillaria ectypa]|nr:hypothetical protein DFS33DRAFT_1378050 [Desarmillaria ectypa]
MSCTLLLVLSILTRHAFTMLDSITIDDTDGRIVYQGTWNDRSVYNSSLDFSGSHSLSEDSSAEAFFTFTGIAVYYLAPLWPYKVDTGVTLDDGPSTTVDLTDASATSVGNGSETVMWNVRWSQTGLTNTPHTLRISMASGGQYIVVDAIRYTVDEPSDSISTSSSISSSSFSSSTTSSPSRTPTSIVDPVSTPEGTQGGTLAIVLGVALGVATLLAAIGLSIFCLRCKQDNPRASYHSTPFPSDPSPLLSSTSTAATTNAQRGRQPLTYFTDRSILVPYGVACSSRIVDVGTIHDPCDHPDNFPLLSTVAEDGYNPYCEHTQSSSTLTSGNQYSQEQDTAFGLQYSEKKGNYVSLSGSDSQMKPSWTPSNWIDYARYHPNTDVVSSIVSTSMPAAEEKRRDSRSNVTSVSNMDSEADIVKSKQVAPARYDTRVDEPKAVDQSIGIDAEDEDAASIEKRRQGLVVTEPPPEHYQ